MHRLVNERGALALRDKLRLDVAVVDKGEIFSWAGAGKFETPDIDKLVGGGVSGSGEFGSFLASVFGGAPDLIRYLGLRNDSASFEYNVPAREEFLHVSEQRHGSIENHRLPRQLSGRPLRCRPATTYCRSRPV